MGILLNLTQEYFGDKERDETRIIFNTKDMKPVDLGGSVYWADRDLERLAGDTKHDKHFSYKEIGNIKFEDGWRLPTMNEYKELHKKNVEHFEHGLPKKTTQMFSYKTETGENYIEFQGTGYYAGSDRLDGSGAFGSKVSYSRLTGDIYDEGTISDEYGHTEEWKQIYAYDISYYKHTKGSFGIIPDFWYLPVRLVKDK